MAKVYIKCDHSLHTTPSLLTVTPRSMVVDEGEYFDVFSGVKARGTDEPITYEIRGSGDCKLKSLTVTSNGTYNASSEGYDGYGIVNVSVSESLPSAIGSTF